MHLCHRYYHFGAPRSIISACFFTSIILPLPYKNNNLTTQKRKTRKYKQVYVIYKKKKINKTGKIPLFLKFFLYYFKEWYNNHHHHAQQHQLSLLFLVVNEGGLCRQLDFHGGRGA